MIDFSELAKEYIKCYKDTSRIYMITHYLKTYDATRFKEVPFLLFPRQQDLCRTLGNAKNIVTTKPRQAGITTVSGGFIACEMVLADPVSPQTVLVIGNTLDLAQQMLFKIRDFLLQFPLWMWGEQFQDKGYDITKPPVAKNVIFDVCNSKELRLKNGCKVIARSSGPDASRGVGGVTWLIFDEAAFIENGRDVYASAIPTVSTGGHVIMISTPNGKDLLYYETCRQAKLKEVDPDHWNNFELIELQWYQDPRYNKCLEWTKRNPETKEIEVYKEETFTTYETNAEGKVVAIEGNIQFNPEHWEQMKSDGWTPRSPWYVKMCKQFNNDAQKIAQELDVSFLGSASNVVDPQFIEMQEKLNVREPEFKDNLIEDTWIWKRPILGHKYMMSIDCSRGDAADRTAIEIIDLNGEDEDGKPIIEQVLEYHGKKTGDDIGEIAYTYGMMYGEAFTTIDCVGGTGDACLLTMMRLGYKNLYYDDPNLKTYTMEREASSISIDKEGRLPGFHSSSVRFQMLTNFASLVKTNQFKIRSKRVITELETWIYKGDAGRIDHMDGCHDDTLTCLAMALFVMQFSMKRMEEARNKDLAMAKAWASNTIVPNDNYKKLVRGEINSMRPGYTMPFYNQGSQKPQNTVHNNYGWLFR